MPDPFDFLLQQPNQNAQSQQLAAALRQLQQQQTLGQLGTLAGKTPVGQMGADVADQATQGQRLLAQIAQQRSQQALGERAQATSEQAEAQKEKYQGEELKQRWAQIQQGKYQQTPYGILESKTGKLTPYGELGAPTLTPKEQESEFTKFAQAVNPYQGRANLNRENMQRLMSAERLEALIKDPTTGQIKPLMPQQVREAATALASLIGGGNTAALGQVEELVPKSFRGDLAKAVQWASNEPTDAKAQSFLQNMLETAAREKGVVGEQIRSGQAASIPAYAQLRKYNKGRFEAILKGAGVDPSQVDESGLYRGPAAGGARGAVAAQVRMRAPDGSVHMVPQEKVEAAKAAGGQVL